MGKQGKILEKHGKTESQHGNILEKHGKTRENMGKSWKIMENKHIRREKNIANSLEKMGKR
jgi:hypothetical protein